jgi:radical SAM superfamily enzyme YgiQ (UPF0313 family)
MRAFEVAKEALDSCTTIAVGPHVTELSEEVLQDYPSLDFTIRGEAEYTLVELLKGLEAGESRGNVKGIAYREDSSVRLNADRPFVENLDDLPFPRHDLLPLDRYVYPFISSRFTFVVTSRGCPYPCTFCRQPIMWRGKVRSRSVDSVIGELRMLKGLGITNFLVHSDTFTVNKDFVVALCKRMIDEKLDMKWGCNSRVDTVDQEMLKWMRLAGCWMIAYGIESGSQLVLDNAKKGATLSQARDAVAWASDAGIKVYGYFIIGLPGETLTTIDETIAFAKALPLTFALFHVGSPYPGTAFHKQAREMGWLNFTRWEDVDQGRSTPVVYPNLSSAEITRGIRRAHMAFYLRPRAIARVLRSVNNLNDLRHLMQLSIGLLKR